MTDIERDELIEKSLLKRLGPEDEKLVQRLLREDELFRQEYEFQEKLIQQVRLKNRQDLRHLFSQFEADHQASEKTSKEDTPIVPLPPVKDSNLDVGTVPLWRQNWFRVAASVTLIAIGAALWWNLEKPAPVIVNNHPDSTRVVTPKDTQVQKPVDLLPLPKAQGPMAQNPKNSTDLRRLASLPYYESDDVSMGFAEGTKTDSYQMVLFISDAKPAYEFQDTLKVYLPKLPPEKSNWSVVYNRTNDLYYLITGSTR